MHKILHNKLMREEKLILGIDTSCDDTSIGLIDDQGNILENKKFSLDCKKFGGIIPELAARMHLDYIDKIFLEIKEKYKEIYVICATIGPGLISSLIIGSTFAKTYAKITSSIFIPIHHLEGHIFASPVNKYPFLSLLISGGHSDLYLCESFGNYKLIAKSLDDSAGEVFDKVGRKYELDFPSGSHIERLAHNVTKKIEPMIPMKNKLQFSFSGLKTKTLRIDDSVENVAWFLQESIGETIKEKLQMAIELTAVNHVVVCGGVAANKSIRAKIQSIENIHCIFPPIELCTDNGVMIALAGLQHYKNETSFVNNFELEEFSRMQLDDYYSSFPGKK